MNAAMLRHKCKACSAYGVCTSGEESSIYLVPSSDFVQQLKKIFDVNSNLFAP